MKIVYAVILHYYDDDVSDFWSSHDTYEEAQSVITENEFLCDFCTIEKRFLVNKNKD